jgi:hypothetical protein
LGLRLQVERELPPVNDDVLPARIRELPLVGRHLQGHCLTAQDCEVLFVPCPAGSDLPPHTHDTDNVGVVLSG